MTIPKLPTVSFANETGYDSDEFDNDSSSQASSSASGVILGFDDGEMRPATGANSVEQQQQQPGESNDEADVTISRIGGNVYFPFEDDIRPPQSMRQCPLCGTTLTLLAQIYAPIQSSKVSSLSPPFPANRYREEFDRILYILGCLKKGCTGVRCLRVGRRNAEWAQEGRRNRAKAKIAEEEARKKASENPFKSSSNPFGSNASVGGTAFSNPFASSGTKNNDFGSMIFGSNDSDDEQASVVASSAPAVQSSVIPAALEESHNNLISESTPSTSSSLWSVGNTVPPTVIPPRYISTDMEHLSTAASSRYAKLAKQVAELSLDNGGVLEKETHKGGRSGKQRVSGNEASSSSSVSSDGEGWSQEAYEIMRVSGVEEVFLAFQEKLESGGAAEQVIRYDFGGIPLPYSGKTNPYSMLWRENPAPGQYQAVTRQSHAPSTQQRSGLRHYDSSCSQIPKCTHCGSARTFEAQLMPNLVNIVEKAIQTTDTKDSGKELGWATVWCFVCSADCFDAREATDGDNNIEDCDEDGRRLDWQGWREEIALPELED